MAFFTESLLVGFHCDDEDLAIVGVGVGMIDDQRGRSGAMPMFAKVRVLNT